MKQEFKILTQRETHINNILASIFAPNFRAVLTFMLTQTYNSHSKGKQRIYFEPKYKWTWPRDTDSGCPKFYAPKK